MLLNGYLAEKVSANSEILPTQCTGETHDNQKQNTPEDVCIGSSF